jgi:hypothetical protein
MRLIYQPTTEALRRPHGLLRQRDSASVEVPNCSATNIAGSRAGAFRTHLVRPSAALRFVWRKSCIDSGFSWRDPTIVTSGVLT